MTAHKKMPQEVGVWLADENQEIARGSVKLLREFLEDNRKHADIDNGCDDTSVDDTPTGKTDTASGDYKAADSEQALDASDAKQETAPKQVNPAKMKKAIVQVRHDDRPARLILNRRPPAAGYALLKYEDDGQKFLADLSRVQL